MPLSTPEILSIVSLFYVSAGFVTTYFGFITRQNDKIAKSNEKIANLEGKMILCEQHTQALAGMTQMQADIATLTEQGKVFWEVIAPRFRDIIHSPIHKVRDALVDKLLDGTIESVKETETLEDELEKLYNDTEASDNDKMIALVFIAATKWQKEQLLKQANTKEGQ
jgi:hypothetical protein